VDPQGVVYVGDRPDVDAAGAIAAGLRAVVIGGRHRSTGPACAYVRSMPDLTDAITRAFTDESPRRSFAVQES
jgi:putative hydrolase of the HAD superfamily